MFEILHFCFTLCTMAYNTISYQGCIQGEVLWVLKHSSCSYIIHLLKLLPENEVFREFQHAAMSH